jgi:3-dehydro-L-gulonate 2-dehydrogenase
MPPWGSLQPRLGNNPIVFALPHGDCPLVMDMALA